MGPSMPSLVAETLSSAPARPDVVIAVARHELRHRARVVRKLLEVPPVEASATPLAHVFLHLLVNAARARRASGMRARAKSARSS